MAAALLGTLISEKSISLSRSDGSCQRNDKAWQTSEILKGMWAWPKLMSWFLVRPNAALSGARASCSNALLEQTLFLRDIFYADASTDS
jgi:hypothetical protein